MSANKFLSSTVYGKFAVTDYNYAKPVSGSLSGLVYVTISSPIYQTISNNIYYSIPSLVYVSISSSFNNKISATVYLTDNSGNKYSNMTYYNFGGSNTNNVLNGYVWNTYLLKTVYNNIITGYTYNTTAYSTNNVTKALFYNSGNTLLGGNLIIQGMIKTPSNNNYALSISGNVIIQPTYQIKTDYLTTNTGKLYIGANMPQSNIFVGSSKYTVATSSDISLLNGQQHILINSFDYYTTTTDSNAKYFNL